MQELKPVPKSHFQVFVDEHSPDDTQTIEDQWQKRKKTERNRKFRIILVSGAITFGLIFALLLNVFLTHEPQHIVLDNSDPNYTYIQTPFPHLKVLVSKHIHTYEAKVFRAVGIFLPELISWIEGNVRQDMKVLYIPEADSGVNLIGMALSYYLKKEQKGGLSIMCQDQAFEDMTRNNMKLMGEDLDRQLPITFISYGAELSEKYDLLIIENSTVVAATSKLQQIPKAIFISHRPKKSQKTPIDQDNSKIQELWSSFDKYYISTGKTSNEISALGTSFGYSLKLESVVNKNRFQLVLYQQNGEKSINLCPEEIELFQHKEYLRNMVEFFRNKTVGTLYFQLDHRVSLEMIQDVTVVGNAVQGGGNFNKEIKDITPHQNNYFVMTFDGFKELSDQPTGTILVFVLGAQEASTTINKFPQASVLTLMPFSNKGCFYPPRLLSPTNSLSPQFIVIS